MNSDVITLDDLTSYLDIDSSAVTARLDLLVDLANGQVAELPVVYSDPPPTRVRAIVLEMAARAHRNPEGYAYERGDDYGYGLPADTKHAGVYMTDAERAELLAQGTVAGSSFMSVPVYSPFDLP